MSANKWSVSTRNDETENYKKRERKMSANKWSATARNEESENNTKFGSGSCVQFTAGKSISTGPSNSSRSNSLSSSGNVTPLRVSRKNSPSRKISAPAPVFDPCVSFTAGKSNVSNDSDTAEEQSRTSEGVNPSNLDNALRKVDNRKVRRGYSVGTSLAPKPLQGLSKAGAVSNIAELFSGGNVTNVDNGNDVKSRKQSATCVLRDDFQMRSTMCKNKVRDPEENEEPTHSINVNTPPSRQKSVEQDAPANKVDKKHSLPLHTRKFSSSTSQATIVESQVVSPKDNVFSVVNSVRYTEDTPQSKQHLTSPPSRRRRLLNNERKPSLSSVENSDDDEGSHVDSAEESELNNWRGRRRSYLAASVQQNDLSSSLDANVEADDEDSDVNVPQTNSEEDNTPKVIKQGPLNRKHEKSNDRRRPVSRTWKPIYAMLKGHRLICYKEGGVDCDDEIIQPIPVRSSIIEIASNYVKKKNVFRMVTSHDNEYLFQAETSTSMMEWVTALRSANPDKESLMKTTVSRNHEKTVNASNSPPSTKSSSSKEKKGGLSIKKPTFAFGTSKKIRIGYSPHAHTVMVSEEELNLPGKTFGIYLSDVPMSAELKNVPAILYNCCSIIEEKGLNQTGLYRVPGNAATSNILKEELDTKEPEDVDWNDEKWFDLNNICTLVKQFLRELADPLIPNRMYSQFIQANRIKPPNDRLKTLKQLIWRLPEFHSDSIFFLIAHLKALADNCSKNLMTEKNIAVILAPNVVRTNEVSCLVQDMSDQIQIVEAMIRHYEWMFDDSEDCLSVPDEVETNSESIIAHSMTQNLMLSLNNMNNQNALDSENEKKGNKFSNLKSNLSLRLRTNKNVSPRTNKKGVVLSPEQYESDGDDNSSESIPTSPALEVKNKSPGAFYKSGKEMMNNAGMSIPTRRSSHTGVTKPPSDIQIQFKHHSPDMSPLLSRNDILRASGKELSAKTIFNKINRLNKMTVSLDEPNKGIGKDDDSCDNGFVSPPRVDSDDASDNSVHGSRKASLDSLSIPSRYNPRNHQSSSIANNDNSNTIYVKTGKLEMSSENVTESEPCVVNRRPSRRKLAASPGVSKRGICTIMPGDDSFEEKVSALIDPDYSGQLKEIARSEMNKPNTVVEPEVPVKRSFPTIALSLNVNQTSNEASFNLTLPKNNGPNAEWWLSDNCTVAATPPRRIPPRPRDKISALSIISNAIDNKKRVDQQTKPKSADTAREVDSGGGDMLTRRIGKPMKLPHKVELSCRVDSYHRQMEECQKKCTNILGPNMHNDVRHAPGESSNTEKIQYYLDQVSKLLEQDY